MGIEPNHLRSLITKTLSALDLYSLSAVGLLMGTAAQESRMGTYLAQLGGGPARGIFQMEPATESDIWKHFLDLSRQDIAMRLRTVTGVGEPDVLALEGNLIYQIGMCRVHYLRRRDPLPEYDDVIGLARYWKSHYNTHLGKGTVREFVDNYHRFVSA